MKNGSVAVVGIGGIFPGSRDLPHFWENIKLNRTAARKVSPERWTMKPEDAYSSQKGAVDKTYSAVSCLIYDTPIMHEGEYADHLNRLDPLFHFVLYAGTQAVKDSSGTPLNPERTGVIIGNIALPTEKVSELAQASLGASAEENILKVKSVEIHDAAPENRYVCALPAGILAGRLGLKGGAYTVDAACASSLYALSLSIEELLSGRCDAMLTGGVSRPDCFYTQMGFSQLNALSERGISAPFDSKADGLVVGEGCGMFLLKRLDDAISHGDRIYALITGIGLSNDRGGSLLAPNSDGQLRSMTKAYNDAGWDPDDVDLIECHATGTPLGDRVEFESMTDLWSNAARHNGKRCIIGSVKSNIGHLLTAAGASGLMKVILAMKERTLPPTANFSEPPEYINLIESPFNILKEPERWERRGKGMPRRAAVSAFGFGGINAHVLIEEYMPGIRRKRKGYYPPPPPKNKPIAIVGMDACFGPWDSIDLFFERIMGKGTDHKPSSPDRWMGSEGCAWFRDKGFLKEDFKGYIINRLSVPWKGFHIPPIELKEMLPQQLLMLLVAKGAVDDASLKPSKNLDTGVFIGLGLDMNTTNFHLRWEVHQRADYWLEKLGIPLTEDEKRGWIEEIKDALFPPLTPGRTIGSLGSIAASRIAREFRFGGPCFTVSSEESSGMSALAAACYKLGKGDIEAALVGAVDLSSDIRAVLSAHNYSPYSGSGVSAPFAVNADGCLIGEGAGAVILKPLDSAISDKNRIYSIIKGIGSASAGRPSLGCQDKKTWQLAFSRAYQNAELHQGSVGLIETAACGNIENDSVEAKAVSDFFTAPYEGRATLLPKNDSPICAIGSLKGDIGNTGAASGIASVIKTALCLYHKVLPPLNSLIKGKIIPSLSEKSYFLLPSSGMYWFHNRADGPRRACVSSSNIYGNCVHMVMESFEGTREAMELPSPTPLSSSTWRLFVLSAPNLSMLIESVNSLRSLASGNRNAALDDILKKWHSKNRIASEKDINCVILSDDTNDLYKKLDAVYKMITLKGEQAAEDLEKRDIFLSFYPMYSKGGIAFLYPGSGNHVSGMGQRLASFFPALPYSQELTNFYLRDQYLPYTGGSGRPCIENDPRFSMMAQVSLATLLTDCLLRFDITPQAAIGYSLGETSAMFSLKAWDDRDGMLKRLFTSSVFTRDLAGEYMTAGKAWKLKEGEPVNWIIGIVNRSEEVVRHYMRNRKRVYLLIVNTPSECVIGGEKKEVEDLVQKMDASFLRIPGATIAHCDIVASIADKYKALHMFPTKNPEGVTFYSGASAAPYELSMETAADSILAHACGCINFPALINRAYKDGIRIFIEIGHGRSLTRMTEQILGGRPHIAQSAMPSEKDEILSIYRLFGRLLAEGVRVDINRLESERWRPEKTGWTRSGSRPTEEIINIYLGAEPFDLPIPAGSLTNTAETQKEKKAFTAIVQSAKSAGLAAARAHESFLTFSARTESIMKDNIHLLLNSIKENNSTARQHVSDRYSTIGRAENATRKIFLDREQCLRFARGSIKEVLGKEYAEIDSFPTRVRLPDEPLMLVDRIISVEGEKLSLSSGRVVTEHDVLDDAWYLDGGVIPTSIAVESGQADLFLAGYLGIDMKTKGLAVYRLLDAVITFHRPLPEPGSSIRYDIRIDRFFKQAATYLFRFNFEATIMGKPFLTMKEGCAGFFTQRELSLGKGIVKRKMEDEKTRAFSPKTEGIMLPMEEESYSDEQVSCLRRGDLAGCFGDIFRGIPLADPVKIPGGRMKLVDRITRIAPHEGKYRAGIIRAEADIRSEDWFLTCHFADDHVMPGTLMYECCLHTLRIYLMRMGWVGEDSSISYHPVPGIASRLRCRGQVTVSTKTAAYEVSVKETGFMPQPYAVVDALMYADGKPIVEITDMSILLRGITREQLTYLWKKTGSKVKRCKKPLFDNSRILAFALGKPSEAFGEPYAIFDSDRIIARLPGPPYKFLDRITEVCAEPWKMEKGGSIEAEYDIPEDAWYFEKNRSGSMPFSILLEIALQPCGWFAAYMGSALHSKKDLHFRNLGGDARCFTPVTKRDGRLTSLIKATNISVSGEMIIQHYSFTVKSGRKEVYKGTTYFGFFTKEALSQQIGIRNAKRYIPSMEEISEASQFPYPAYPPFPEDMLRMIDKVELFSRSGGSSGKGFIRGIKRVNSKDWFFKAHFYQDPVWPGSLGLESFLQLLKAVAFKRWGGRLKNRMETVILNEKHAWVYRGQILPTDRMVTVEAVITEIDDAKCLIRGEGYLSVDGRIIYSMQTFGIEFLELMPAD